MAAGADIKVKYVQVERMLRNMQASLTPAAIGVYLTSVVHPRLRRRAANRFNQEGDDAVGGKWTPLRQSTLEIKAALGYGNKRINERTGHLRDSVVNARPVVGHNGLATTLDFPGNWDRPDLFWRSMQAAGLINTHEPRPVVGVTHEDDVAHMLASLTAWVVGGKGVRT